MRLDSIAFAPRTPSHLLPHRTARAVCGAGVVGVCALGFYVLGAKGKGRKVQACAEYQHSSLCTGLRAGLERQVMTL